MNAPLMSAPRVEPFFFDGDPGTRFSLYHAPDPHLPARGAILYVHPFAEELNRGRRMAAVQARRFAALGFAVLQIDLFGCGDSCGDFSLARWDIWKRDLATARAWLAERSGGPMHLWGMRLGGLLALDYACGAPVERIILWQPVLNGRSAIGQFLRQQLADGGVATRHAVQRSTEDLREALVAQGLLEVAGYELAADLASAIEALDAAAMPLPACRVDWFASSAPAPARLAANAERLRANWAPRGVEVRLHTLDGQPFWRAQDNNECPALLEATARVFATEAV
jgi:exosortase A-associated hydrolase 2